jgi:hypothetical protein
MARSRRACPERSRRNPGDAYWQMLFADFRPQEIKKVTASERTRISYFTAPSAATYAALSKESRMKSTEANGS